MIKQLAFRPVLSCGLSTWLRRNTLLLALPMLASSCDPGQLEPDANAVAINVLGLTSDATKLVVTTTLDGKATTNTEPMEVTTKLTRFGLRLAKELTGTLTVGIDAYDAELCKVGSGSVSTPVGSPYRFEITASMKTVSPRQCPPPPPAKPKWSAVERDIQRQLKAGETVVVTLRGLHDNVIEWAKENGARFTLGPAEFKKRIERLGCGEQYAKPHGKTERAWSGIRLRRVSDDAADAANAPN